MRAVIQRVKQASVTVDSEIVGAIGAGLLVLLGAGQDDQDSDTSYLAQKVCELRIFEDDAGKMNRSLIDIDGELLVVSQFTLYGDCRRGRRPSFGASMPPERASVMVDDFVRLCGHKIKKVATGRFGAMMDVALVNDGPVTILLDSAKLF